jgi:hypothetical protein
VALKSLNFHQIRNFIKIILGYFSYNNHTSTCDEKHDI